MPPNKMRSTAEKIDGEWQEDNRFPDSRPSPVRSEGLVGLDEIREHLHQNVYAGNEPVKKDHAHDNADQAKRNRQSLNGCLRLGDLAVPNDAFG